MEHTRLFFLLVALTSKQPAVLCLVPHNVYPHLKIFEYFEERTALDALSFANYMCILRLLKIVADKN